MGTSFTDAAPPAVRGANVDKRLVSAVAWQAGHVGASSPRTSVSNSCVHSLQAYSYRGIVGPPRAFSIAQDGPGEPAG